VTLAVLVCVLFSAVHVMAFKQITDLSGREQSLALSKVVPNTLSYQGYLVDASDSSAVTATLEMTFRLFYSETKGTELWSETHPTVEISNSLFHVLLGSVTPFPVNLFDGSALWLQTEVGAEILAPRKPLVSVAYSQRADDAAAAETAGDAHHLEGYTVVDLDDRWVNESDLDHLNAADGDPVEAVYVDDAGKVGVGTTSPLTELDVNGSVQATAYYGDGSNLTGISGTPDGDWAISGNHMYSAVPGSVGVGTSSPENKLHVAGDVKATTYYGDGSNLTGISGAADGDWTISGSHMHSAVPGSVGVGTSSPESKLHVAGDVKATTYYGDGSNLTGTADGDWIVSGNILSPDGDYGLSMRSSNAMYGMNDSTHVNFGIACTTGASGQDDKYCTVSGGSGNTASHQHTTVGGGAGNTASEWDATVGGGYYNTASAFRATVGGGSGNTASFTLATVGGGSGNTASDYCATVGGGINNTSGYGSTVGGGFANSASGAFATVGGGFRDTVKAYGGGVAAGCSNLAGDAATDTAAFVGGGYNNSATSRYATVGGGESNTASNFNATVGGGIYNTASAPYTTVSGGNSNTASNAFATVGGGWDNTAGPYGSTVGGGVGNESNAFYSFTVGNTSTVPSSYSNSAAFNGQTATASAQTRVGALSKVSGTFTIDHPTEPMNRILNHYFVESPEMVLIYRGVAIIGSDSRAEVHLPDYFDALNRNPMVQLTGVGTSDVYVSEKVTGNRFVIGGKPETEVYWTVTGDRKDPSAEITRILMPVEQLKTGDLAGHSLDDDFLATTMSQLERMGQAGKFSFRTQAGREKYERSRQALENAGQLGPGRRD
ncbi:hypothetical protein ACFL0G_05750, partial [Candidatus Zixiibacteriota bacterium]